MAGCNPVHRTGAGAGLSIHQPDDLLLDPTGTELYQSITGSLMFLSQCTCYDITYSVNQFARAMSKPSKLHITAAKHFLRYLKGTMSLVLTYPTACSQLTGFCDASWGHTLGNGKSTSGYLVPVYDGQRTHQLHDRTPERHSAINNGLVSMALPRKEAVYLSNMMAELELGKLFHGVPLFVLEGNQIMVTTHVLLYIFENYTNPRS